MSENHISISQPLIITYKSVHFQFSMTSCTCCCHRNCQLTQLVFSLQQRTSYDCEALVKRRKLSLWTGNLIPQAVDSSPPLLPICLHMHHQITQFQTLVELGWRWWKLSSATNIKFTALSRACLQTAFLGKNTPTSCLIKLLKAVLSLEGCWRVNSPKLPASHGF